jgi:DNA polymerase-3 subunit gamma/tau
VGQALYRKYRSKKLSEIVGQEHITDTLARAIKTGKISHAYLFTGPRGVGKTSIARILAHEVNNLPYSDESIHLDIIEIDAASNRRIDEIRDLRDKVHIAPSSAKYKVYIIDEVHMLTKEAFNALLKTLEEPPAHVIFILATTEVHKLPETIISRAQRFTFKAIDHDKAVEHLRAIAKHEGMQVDDEALELLARHGGGSFRDAISLLDQVGNSKKIITKDDVEELLGVAPETAVAALLTATLTGSPADIVKSLDEFTARGIAPAQIAKQLAALLRRQLLGGEVAAQPRIITGLLAALLSVPTGIEPMSNLEIALFGANLETKPAHITAQPITPSPPKVTPTPKADTPKPKLKDSGQTAKKEPEPTPLMHSGEDISAWWPQLVTKMKQHNNTIYGVLRMAHPVLNGDTLQLSFAFQFHAKKVTDAATIAKLQDSIKTLTGRDLNIKAIHDKNLKGIEPNLQSSDMQPSPIPDIQAEEPTNDISLGAITSVFGGGEVLES